uniref:Uncharacterized protein n=1 Tax=Anopheles albimanus TaxID=7167 RepID=A0A182FWJ5_ANOAL
MVCCSSWPIARCYLCREFLIREDRCALLFSVATGALPPSSSSS